ncbi:MAG: type II secretion system protein [Chloroflexota bacterium]|nr:type II secretion system protein [Chloroflexota bacterium]
MLRFKGHQWSIRSSFSRGERGATLIEVVISIVVLGLITASVPALMVLMVDAEFKRNEQRIVESLTRMQIEYIKSTEYIYGNATSPNPEYGLVPVPNASYAIDVIAHPIRIDPLTQAHTALPSGQDEGIQEIMVSVYHVDMDNPVLRTRNYKVDR